MPHGRPFDSFDYAPYFAKATQGRRFDKLTAGRAGLLLANEIKFFVPSRNYRGGASSMNSISQKS